MRECLILLVVLHQGIQVLSWLCEPGIVLRRRQVRHSNTEPLVDEVELLQANPNYAHVCYIDGRETTVSTRHLAPAGEVVADEEESHDHSTTQDTETGSARPGATFGVPTNICDQGQNMPQIYNIPVRRSGRVNRP